MFQDWDNIQELNPKEAANIIFVGDYLRILSVKHRDGAVVLEDGFAEIPERPVESSSDEEE